MAALPFAVLQAAVVPALPTLQRELGASTTWTAWTVTGFLVVAAVTTPLFSRLGDQHGKAKLILVSLAIFIGGAIGATFAWDIGSLIGFRAIQGTSAAVFPLAFAIVKDQIPARQVGFAMGLIASIGGVGGGVGLLLSGVVLDNLTWRWLFAIAALIAAAAAIVVHRVIHDEPSGRDTRLDVPGAILLMAALASLMVGLTEGPELGWGDPVTLALFAGALVLFAIWVVVEKRVAVPLVDLNMLLGRTVFVTNLATLVVGFAMFATFVVVPVLVEAPRGLSSDLASLVDYGFGGSSTLTGLLILPASMAIVVGGLWAGWMVRRVAPGTLFSAGILILGLGSAAVATAHASEWQLAVAMLPFGLGIGIVLALGPILITGAVRDDETSVAIGMNTVLRVIGSVIGGQVAAAILASVTFPSTTVPRDAAFTSVFWMSAGAAFLAAAAATLIVPRRGRFLSRGG
jgi:MFS family permease